MQLARALALMVVLVAGSRSARADLAGDFAHFFQVDVAKVDEVSGFELPPSVAKKGGFTHVIVGRFSTTGSHRQRGAVAMRCNAKECRGSTVYLDVDAELTLWGLVDLDGKATVLKAAIPERHWGTYASVPIIGTASKRMSWPALVFETRTRREETGDTRFRRNVTGTVRRDAIHIISLRVARDERPARVLRASTVDRGFSGAGTSTSYRLERGKTRGALDLIATEQRHLEDKSLCLRPKPTEYRLVIEDGRYQRASELDLPRGCR